MSSIISLRKSYITTRGINSIFVIFILFSNNLFSQALDFSIREVDCLDTYFQTDYIRKNKIKSIHFIFSEMPDGERIIEKNYSTTLFFKSDGKINYAIDVFKQYNKTIDSTVRYFYFDKQNRLFSIRKIKNDENTAHYYTYDDKNRLIKNQEFKEELSIIEDAYFKVESQQLISTETFSCEDFSANQYKKHYLNDAGKEYKFAIVNFKDSLQVTDIFESFSISGVYEHTFYTYDNFKNVSSIEIKTNASGDFTRKWLNVFEDKVLKEQKIYLDEVMTSERYFFYEKDLLVSELTRKSKNKQIDLTKYEYTFY